MQRDRKIGDAPQTERKCRDAAMLSRQCIGCSNCNGLCQALLEMMAVPDLVLSREHAA